MINDLWKDMNNMEFGGGKRNLNAIRKLAEAHTRLRLSAIVDKDIMEETLSHYKVMLLEQGKVVIASEDIRKVVMDAITQVIKQTQGAISFEGATFQARIDNQKVKDYLGEGKLTCEENHKYRDIYERFREMKDAHINTVSEKPLTYKWTNDSNDVYDGQQ